jgi:DNA mismatch repair protein MutL
VASQNLINLLDIQTTNRIAAGEVVERPASVVKELVENAIDAGAGRITVKILNNKLDKIQVSDNGCGIAPDDLRRALLRHATSKISCFDDMQTLNSLGFRGEALPAIAAVSELTLISRQTGSLSGYKLISKDGKAGLPEPAGCPEGTTVLVDKLFANVPARKSFLKSQAWEMGQIADLINRFALAHPKIAFTFSQGEKTILATYGSCELAQAFMAVYGRSILPYMLEVEWLKQIIIKGMISLPEVNRANRHHYSCFVNGRWVYSRELNQAIDEAYETLLPIKRYPTCVLNLFLAPSLLDVNVHPSKMEIKFKEPDLVKNAVTSAIKETLRIKEILTPHLDRPLWQRDTESAADGNISREEENSRQTKAKQQCLVLRSPDGHKPSLSQILSGKALFLPEQNTLPAPGLTQAPETLPNHAPPAPFTDGGAPKGQDLPYSFAEESERQGLPVPIVAEADPKGGYSAKELCFADLSPLGQLDGTFILASGEDGLYIIDQHAAHERILYEKIAGEATRQPGASKLLALPLSLELTYQEHLCLINNIVELKEIGFIVEHFGDNTFILRGVPAWYRGSEGEQLLLTVLARLIEKNNAPAKTTKKLREEEIFQMACKGAVKANQYLTSADISAIFQSLDNCQSPSTCPHGRPVAIKLTLEEIRKRFLRNS